MGFLNLIRLCKWIILALRSLVTVIDISTTLVGEKSWAQNVFILNKYEQNKESSKKCHL